MFKVYHTKIDHLYDNYKYLMEDIEKLKGTELEYN